MEEDNLPNTEDTPNTTQPTNNLPNTESTPNTTQLTKSQLKKQRRKEMWLKKKSEKKKKRKSKPKAKTLYRTNNEEWEQRRQQGLKVIVDCDFDVMLTEKEHSSLKQQLMFCHAANKKSDHPCRLILTGVSERLENAINKVSYGKWAVDMHREPYIELFEPDKLVYLTADSDETLDSFESDKIYIIGGLVDHNRLKLITQTKATQQGIKTAKLPLDRFVDLSSSKVLTVNHVFDLITKYVSCNDWRSAIVESIPSRKKVKLKDEDSGEEGE
jgi:tRNA (guanine9-N1)-methyltransferase